jgi:hypothetical protein
MKPPKVPFEILGKLLIFKSESLIFKFSVGNSRLSISIASEFLPRFRNQRGDSGKKAKHLQFSSSTNSTQIIGIQSDDDDIDAELVDSLCGDYFDTWSSK